MSNPNGTLRALRFRDLKGYNFSETTTGIALGEDIDVELIIEAHSNTAMATVRRLDSQKIVFSTKLTPSNVQRILSKSFILKNANLTAFCIKCKNDVDASRLDATLKNSQINNASEDWFDRKTEQSSSEMYFHYYGMLQHQQNMLQDYVRTGTYYTAFLHNSDDFKGKTVMDVGAGSGILSLFAAQAGARKVYAVEASPMARFAEFLVAKNGVSGCTIEVIEEKIEALKLNEKVDVLISEPIGTLLVNERMLETYVFARDNFLKPGGKLFPSFGRIYSALFTEDILYQEILSKATFWLQENFYGVDLTCLHHDAVNQYFNQVVIDSFDPSILVSNHNIYPMDFATVREEELYDIDVPLDFVVGKACMVHGLACWFDLLFAGSSKLETLTTAPGQATTHWFQLRCVLPQPLCAVKGSHVTGSMRLQAHSKQSYNIKLCLKMNPPSDSLPPQTVAFDYDLKDPYYRQLVNYWQTQMAPVPYHRDGQYDNQMY